MLKVSLYDDYESFLLLKLDFMEHTPLTGLEEVIDPHLVLLSFVAPSLSSTPRETTVDDLTLLASPIPLAQCTKLEMCDPSRRNASFVKDDLLDWSEEPTLIEPFLEKAPFVESCGDGVVVGATPSIEHINPICTKSLDLTPISSLFLPTTLSHLHTFHESLGNIRGYDHSFDLYCACLEDMLRKIELTTFFDYSFDFSVAFDKCTTALTIFA